MNADTSLRVSKPSGMCGIRILFKNENLGTFQNLAGRSLQRFRLPAPRSRAPRAVPGSRCPGSWRPWHALKNPGLAAQTQAKRRREGGRGQRRRGHGYAEFQNLLKSGGWKLSILKSFKTGMVESADFQGPSEVVGLPVSNLPLDCQDCDWQ